MRVVEASMPDFPKNPEGPGAARASLKPAFFSAITGIAVGFLDLAAAALTDQWTLAGMGFLFLFINGFLFAFLTWHQSRIPECADRH